MICSFCLKEWKSNSSLTQHVRACKDNPDRVIAPPKSEAWKESMKNKRANNQYTKPGLDYIISDSTREKLSVSSKGKTWSEERKLRHSQIMSAVVENNPDSYTKNNVCGRVKIIDYNGTKLKGTWEVRVAKWLDSISIRWESEANPSKYYWEGKTRKYFPDFYLIDYDVYIEVKGYRTERDLCKWDQFEGKLLIIDKMVIKSIEKYTLLEAISELEYKPGSTA